MSYDDDPWDYDDLDPEEVSEALEIIGTLVVCALILGGIFYFLASVSLGSGPL